MQETYNIFVQQIESISFELLNRNNYKDNFLLLVMVKRGYKSKRKEASSRSEVNFDKANNYDTEAKYFYRIAARYIDRESGAIEPENVEAYEKAIKSGNHFRDAASRAFRSAVQYRRISRGHKPFTFFRGLERSAEAVFIIGILAGTFFLSPNVTGNVVGNMTNSTSNILGVFLIIIGLIGGYFSFKKR